jgi:hypothetical protein
MTEPDYDAWFRGYAEAYTQSLQDGAQIEAIRSHYAETVLALGVDGTLNAAEATTNLLRPVLEHLFAFYVSIGARRMEIDRVEVTPLYENHDRVLVCFLGHYVRPDGSQLTIPFDVVYLVQRRTTGPVIFAFIAGDETALYRQYGLVDDNGEALVAT